MDTYEPTGEIRPAQRVALRVLVVFAMVAFAASLAAAALQASGASPGFAPHAYLALHAAGALGCLTRAAWVARDRATWLCVGFGALAWTAAWSDFAITGGPVDISSVGKADLLWGSAYPGWLLAIVLITRARFGRRGATAWLDGLVGALAVAALSAATVAETLIAQGTPSILTFAFPLLDTLVLGLFATTLAGAGWRLSRAGALLGLGLLLLVVGDSIHAVVGAVSGYAPGRSYEALWALGIAARGGAAWAPARPAHAGEHTHRGLVFPTTFGVIALGVLVWAAAADLNAGAIVLAGLALALVLARLLVTLHDANVLAESRRLSLTDEVTGAPNRRALLGEARAAVEEPAPFALLMLDLDRFKELNDTLGHQAGDDALRLVARRLRRAVDGGGFVGRLGGDEFGLVVRGDRARAEQVARAVRDALTDPLHLDGISVAVSASIGIALHPEHGPDVSSLLRSADVAMYEAKRTSAVYRFYAGGEDGQPRERLELAGALGGALARGELVLRYQPVASLATGEVTSVEALVRWRHPTRGELAPGAFLPAVEHTPLMRRLTAYVLDHALAAAARLPREMAMAVNVSPQDVLDEGFAEQVSATLARHRVQPQRLILEVTETAVLADPDQAAETLAGLRALGVRVALDDFGTGYSSLTHLHRMRVDIVKVDRSFVAALRDDPAARAIVRSTVVLAHALGATVVAEGVETLEAVRLARANGCDAVQGFALARPLRLEDVEARAAEIAVGLRPSRGPVRPRPRRPADAVPGRRTARSA